MSKTGITFSTADRVLIIAPHPDDESLGCGGLIQRAITAGAELNVLFITDGDNNPWPQRFLERRWSITHEEARRWGKRRRLEAIEALVRLGAPPDCADFLSLPDQGLTRLLLNDPGQLLDPLASTLENWQPTLIVSPCIEDVHPDHCAIHIQLRHLLRNLAGPQPEVLFYRIHGNGIPISTPRFVLTLTKAEQEKKREAILAHVTQMALSKKRFLQYASPGEAYYRLAEDSTPEAIHNALFHAGEIMLRLHPRVVLRRRANLLFAWDDENGDFRSRSISLRQAKIIATPAGPEVRLQIPEFPAARQVFVKYQLKRIYFEQYGWQTLRTLPASGGVRPLASHSLAG
jgi:LmbE family N-acetylglucosaminyl deacetylase